MGSLGAACLSGFLCRLCSEMHRLVIHIYSERGLERDIDKKINDYLPITVSRYDPLPKTICLKCMSRVEKHHDLMVTMARNKAIYLQRSRMFAGVALPRLTQTQIRSASALQPSDYARIPLNIQRGIIDAVSYENDSSSDTMETGTQTPPTLQEEAAIITYRRDSQ